MTRCDCCTAPAPRQRKSRRRPATPLSPLAALLLAFQSSPIHGLAPSTLSSPHRQRQGEVLTRRYYRHAQDEFPTLTNAEAAAAAAVGIFSTPSSTIAPPENKMPAWLSRDESHLSHERVAALQEALVRSHLTNTEARQVLLAAEQATHGNLNKVAGVSEFALILLETMEMGADAIVAGIFHYCACVAAREQSLFLPPAMASSPSSWEHYNVHAHPSGMRSFGEDAALIARDAAKLKRTEMVAASVMMSSRQAGRATPDVHEEENLRNLLLMETTDWRALAVRSAACLYRLKGLLAARDHEGNPSLTPEEVRTSREALHIFAPLASRLGMHRLKNEIEGIAFRILYRRQYEKVMSMVHETRNTHHSSSSIKDEMKAVLAEVTEGVQSVLSNDPMFSRKVEKFHVSSRMKEPYSLWRKMLKNSASGILDVHDALALRIVIQAKKMDPNEPDEVTRARDRALCYYAKEALQDRLGHRSNSHRFKDYIARPKANGYQSLHYTTSAFSGGEEWPYEVQIRSSEMHQVAEFGLAAHFEYKSKSGSSSAPFQHDEYLKAIQEWNWQNQNSWIGSEPSASQTLEEKDEHLAPYIEALTSAQSELGRNFVFVFFGGKILSLPSGACVLDALRQGGMNVSKANVNGYPSNDTDRLKNGDVLTPQW